MAAAAAAIAAMTVELQKSETESACDWTALPLELLREIFKYFDALSLCNAVGNVCTHWKSGVETIGNDVFEKGFDRYLGREFRKLYPVMDYAIFSSLANSVISLSNLTNFEDQDGYNIRARLEGTGCLKREWLISWPKDTPWIFAVPSRPNFMIWIGIIHGPSDSPYQNGVFYIKLRFPKTYPKTPPRATFLTKIFHPGVNPSNGELLVNTMEGGWADLNYYSTVTSTTALLMLSIQSLLTLTTDSNSNSDCESTAAIGKLFKENRSEFNRMTKKWTQKYAQQHLLNQEAGGGAQVVLELDKEFYKLYVT